MYCGGDVCDADSVVSSDSFVIHVSMQKSSRKESSFSAWFRLLICFWFFADNRKLFSKKFTGIRKMTALFGAVHLVVSDAG